jgi:hypothetical protein
LIEDWDFWVKGQGVDACFLAEDGLLHASWFGDVFGSYLVPIPIKSPPFKNPAYPEMVRRDYFLRPEAACSLTLWPEATGRFFHLGHGPRSGFAPKKPIRPACTILRKRGGNTTNPKINAARQTALWRCRHRGRCARSTCRWGAGSRRGWLCWSPVAGGLQLHGRRDPRR